MNNYRRPRRSAHGFSAGPLVAFLLIASLGIMMAGCSSGDVAIKGPGDVPQEEEFTFTEEDVARFHRLAQGETGGTLTESGSAASGQLDLSTGKASSSASPIILDLSMAKTYQNVRTGTAGAGGNIYKVTNDILNVRSGPSAGAGLVLTLKEGDSLSVTEFTNGQWAKVKLSDGKEGYVTSSYISKVVAEENLPQEEKAFAGLYYVDFAFLNVRAAANTQSAKLGEIPGRAFLQPLSVDKEWARIPFQGKEGYVSTQYLKPFRPNFLVRQGRFQLPVFVYTATEPVLIQAAIDHAKALKAAGANVMTMSDFRELVLAQEKRDVRLPPKSAVIAFVGATPQNVQSIADTLSAASVKATIFIETRHVGLSGITEKMLQTLTANGFDLQSAGHTGDDLRSLTTAQIKLELEQSRKLIEDATKKPVFAVYYPQGGVNDRVIELANGAGYLFGLGNQPEGSFTRDQFLRLPTFGVTSGMKAEDIVKLLK